MKNLFLLTILATILFANISCKKDSTSQQSPLIGTWILTPAVSNFSPYIQFLDTTYKELNADKVVTLSHGYKFDGKVVTIGVETLTINELTSSKLAVKMSSPYGGSMGAAVSASLTYVKMP